MEDRLKTITHRVEDEIRRMITIEDRMENEMKKFEKAWSGVNATNVIVVLDHHHREVLHNTDLLTKMYAKLGTDMDKAHPQEETH